MVMNFTVNFSSGKFGNAAISPCATITPPLRLSASMPSKMGMVPAPAVQSSATSTPLPPGPLDQHARIVADAAVEQRPLDPVRHRSDQAGQLRRDALGHMVHDRVPGEIHILRKSAPEMRRLLVGRVAVADRVGIGAPVGVLAVSVLAEMAPFAFAAHDVVLDKDQVALLEALAARELAAGLGNHPDVLVPHDGGLVVRGVRIELDVGAEYAGDH